MPAFYEFFAGGGMARAGLGDGWTCLFANDFDVRKAAAYRANWGGDALRVGDVAAVAVDDLPGRADLAWASFPCQDLSLAGGRAGLAGGRSGAFWPFMDLMKGLRLQGRAPRILAIENVCGALTSRGGADFQALCRAFLDAGYRPAPMVIDAAAFVPQSRPRLFVVGLEEGLDPAGLSHGLSTHPADPATARAVEAMPDDVRSRTILLRPPTPRARSRTLGDLLEADPADAPWHDAARTDRLLELMAPLHRARVEAARASGGRAVGALYRRTRIEDGRRRQRAEVRFDGLAGCLRTPGGGSSRQTLVVVDKGIVRTRLISGREMARLMGLADSYILPARFGEAAHLTGDGVAAPVVRHLAQWLFEPLLAGTAPRAAA